jgi:small subunit ribosomal protein S17
MTDAKLNRELSGEVISAVNDKTIVVVIKRREKHKLLGKYITRSTKIHAHDEKNVCGVGDQVIIQECRPYSKKKSWKLSKLVLKAAAR